MKLPAPPRDDADPSSSSPQPTKEILSFLRHLQVTIDSSYVSPLPSDGSPNLQSTSQFGQQGGQHYPFPSTPSGVPSTPTSRRASGALSLPSHIARRVSGGPPLPSGSPTPSTPLPTPSVGSNEERRYVRSEGVSVWSSIWTPSTTNGLYLAWSEEENLWVGIWALDVPVAFVRTKITDPLLCLTASITLREKETVNSIRGYESYESTLPSSSEASPILQDFGEDIVDPTSVSNSDLLQGVAKSSFPAARFHGPQPSISSNPLNPLSRSQGPTVVPPTTLLSLPTLRKSFRTILELASGLNLRMRTIYLPYLVLGGGATTNEGDEDEEEERKVVVSVEVESTAGTGLGFKIEHIDFKVGGSGGATARVELLSEESGILPLELNEGDQYSLLYVVSFDPSASPEGYSTPQEALPSASISSFQPHDRPGPRQQPPPPLNLPPAPASTALPNSHRPVSIAVRGRPFILSSRGDETEHPTDAFVSKWNCTLDLSHLTEATEEKLNLPALAGVATAIPTSNGKAASRPASLVAGNKRFSFANVSSLAQPSLPPKPVNGSLKPGPRDPIPQPLPTPAFPPQHTAPILPPSQQPFAPSSQPHVSTPRRTPEGRGGSLTAPEKPQYQHEEDGVLVSINVLRQTEHGGYVSLRRKDAVRPLEPFVLEVFVFNGTARTRRFALGVPEKRRRRLPVEPQAEYGSEQEGWIGACGLGSSGASTSLLFLTESSLST